MADIDLTPLYNSLATYLSSNNKTLINFLFLLCIDCRLLVLLSSSPASFLGASFLLRRDYFLISWDWIEFQFPESNS